MLNLSYHPQDLLTQLVKWKPSIQLTASILDEIASNLKDYFKRENRSINDFIDANSSITADFTADPIIGHAPLTVNFYDNSVYCRFSCSILDPPKSISNHK